VDVTSANCSKVAGALNSKATNNGNNPRLPLTSTHTHANPFK
jgi:hypothetical protein